VIRRFCLESAAVHRQRAARWDTINHACMRTMHMCRALISLVPSLFSFVPMSTIMSQSVCRSTGSSPSMHAASRFVPTSAWAIATINTGVRPPPCSLPGTPGFVPASISASAKAATTEKRGGPQLGDRLVAAGLLPRLAHFLDTSKHSDREVLFRALVTLTTFARPSDMTPRAGGFR